MPVNVTFRHVKPTDALRQHAEEKLERITKFIHRPFDAHVVLSVIKRRHIAELIISGEGLHFTATEETADLYSAIDLAMVKIEHQASRQTAKRKDRKHGSSVPAGRPTRGAATPTARARRSRAGELVAAERVSIKPMSVEEGILQMNAMKKEFLLFRNEASATLNVVYRRRDGAYGLIEPDED